MSCSLCLYVGQKEQARRALGCGWARCGAAARSCLPRSAARGWAHRDDDRTGDSYREALSNVPIDLCGRAFAPGSQQSTSSGSPGLRGGYGHLARERCGPSRSLGFLASRYRSDSPGRSGPKVPRNPPALRPSARPPSRSSSRPASRARLRRARSLMSHGWQVQSCWRTQLSRQLSSKS